MNYFMVHGYELVHVGGERGGVAGRDRHTRRGGVGPAVSARRARPRSHGGFTSGDSANADGIIMD